MFEMEMEVSQISWKGKLIAPIHGPIKNHKSKMNTMVWTKEIIKESSNPNISFVLLNTQFSGLIINNERRDRTRVWKKKGEISPFPKPSFCETHIAASPTAIITLNPT